jgi:hypothetical protein
MQLGWERLEILTEFWWGNGHLKDQVGDVEDSIELDRREK